MKIYVLSAIWYCFKGVSTDNAKDFLSYEPSKGNADSLPYPPPSKRPEHSNITPSGEGRRQKIKPLVKLSFSLAVRRLFPNSLNTCKSAPRHAQPSRLTPWAVRQWTFDRVCNGLPAASHYLLRRGAVQTTGEPRAPSHLLNKAIFFSSDGRIPPAASGSPA
ncbi:hypothetical protein CCHR01_18872 [Colletotrichum chrysophilum]|uniref:Uncharacterized protein n=1 Tax=Colletotrichum chrysophilum TaxID=1836956 RepID=A0AAD9E8A7_9PEZI|nr:hypothetical protein CCHR01_18872 [Colletotrichum chrysophilum]